MSQGSAFTFTPPAFQPQQLLPTKVAGQFFQEVLQQPVPLQFQDDQGTLQTVQIPLQQLVEQLPPPEVQTQSPSTVIPIRFQDSVGITRTLQIPLQELTTQIQTQVAGQFAQFSQQPSSQIIPLQYQDAQGNIQTIQFPVSQLPAELIPFTQQLAGQLIPFEILQQFLPSIANLQALPQFLSIPQAQGPVTGDTGPAALIIIIGGAAAGVGFSRRRKLKN